MQSTSCQPKSHAHFPLLSAPHPVCGSALFLQAISLCTRARHLRRGRRTRAAFSAGAKPTAMLEMALMKPCVAGATANALTACAAEGLLFRKPVTRLNAGVPMLFNTVSYTAIQAGSGYRGIAQGEECSSTQFLLLAQPQGCSCVTTHGTCVPVLSHTIFCTVYLCASSSSWCGLCCRLQNSCIVGDRKGHPSQQSNANIDHTVHRHK